MSGIPPSNSNNGQSWNSTELPGALYDDGYYRATDEYGPAAAGWDQNIQEEGSVPGLTVPEYGPPPEYQAALGLSSEGSSYVGHDLHAAQLENVGAYDASMLVGFTQQQYYPEQVDHAHHQTHYAPAQEPTYGQAPYVPDHLYGNTQGHPTWPPMNHQPFQDAFIPPVPPSHVPAPPLSVPVVHSAPVPVAGPALPSQPGTNNPQAANAHVSRPKKPCPTCGRFFDPKPSNWDRHQRTHTKTMRFGCTICEAKRVTQDQVIVHYIRKHLGVPGHLVPLPEERNEAREHAVEL
ncbi:hypothetical protein V565_238090 [Rhizoctonia solani 123E]|uniref:C2H2-type domain-containing protein n=1 Tax=Rhizoctonia solani 123E TaxID=1423351 RepID=A0A074RGE0_9AGAM|nr:hypothetical protein V565_238090 [Rhizoctonia solani 123E]